MKETVTLIPKMCSYVTEDNDVKKKEKGTKKSM